MVIASLNTHVFENWKNKQKHSSKTVQIYMGARGVMTAIIYKLFIATAFGTLAMFVYCTAMDKLLKKSDELAKNLVIAIWVTQTITIFLCLMIFM